VARYEHLPIYTDEIVMQPIERESSFTLHDPLLARQQARPQGKMRYQSRPHPSSTALRKLPICLQNRQAFIGNRDLFA
jgi:hypothetical protein